MIQRPRQLRRRAQNVLNSAWQTATRPRRPASRPVRFITSFNEKLFDASGQRCIETFCRFNPHLDLVVYVESETPEEGDRLREKVEALGATFVALDELPLLSQFLERACDLIPQSLGGIVPDSDFPGEEPNSPLWFRKHMYRWFRKTVALNHAMSNVIEDSSSGIGTASSVLVWMDCDCFSTRRLPASVVERAFKGAGIFHMKGTRPYSETGVVGYDLARPGVRDFIAALADYYMQRRFEPFERWDDCFAFDYLKTELQASEPKLSFHDIGGQADEMGHILNTTLLASYLTHDKGLHSRKLVRKLNL